MREYGQIQCAFWVNPSIKSLSNDAKLFAAYLLTGPHSNGLGCHQLPKGYVQADLGWSPEQVSDAFAELESIGFAKWCKATGYVLVHKYLKWNPLKNSNVATARQKEYESIPSAFTYHGELAVEMLTYGKHYKEPFLNHLETVSKQFRNHSRTAVRNSFETRPYPTRPDPSGPKEGIDRETGEVLAEEGVAWN